MITLTINGKQVEASEGMTVLEVAKKGQNSYKRIWTKEGKNEFCERFVDMITPK